jgi:hypothetical protein
MRRIVILLCLFAIAATQASPPKPADESVGVSLLDDYGSSILVKTIKLPNGQWRACFVLSSGQVWLGQIRSYVGRNHAIIVDIKPGYALIQELVPVNRGEWAMSSFKWPTAHPAKASKFATACEAATAKSG